jgi:hypothetical protein
VFVSLDDTLQFGLDCVAMLSPGRWIAYGWAMAPRGVATELAVLGPDGECPVEHCSFHPRRDVIPADPSQVAVNGFTLIFALPRGAEPLEFTLGAGPLMLRADMRGVEKDLCKATLSRAAEINLGLLRAASDDPVVRAMLRHGGRPLGAFGDWIAKLTPLRGRAQTLGMLAEAEAVFAASGEAVVMLRAGEALAPEAALDAIVIGWLLNAEGVAEPAVLPLADQHAARLPAAFAFYGRVEPAVLERLHALELVVRVELRPGEELCLRCHPARGTVLELLETVARTTAASLALPFAGPDSPGLDMLRQVIARREAAFSPTLAALAAGRMRREQDIGQRPRVALLLGADDPAAARLIQVVSSIFESRFDTLLVMGSAAEEVAERLGWRGWIRVIAGDVAAQALRDAAGREGIAVVEADALAQAVIAGAPDTAFSRPIDGAEVARLLTLHAIAGGSPSLAGSLKRMLHPNRTRGIGFELAPRTSADRHAAELVGAHLTRLWEAGAQARASAPEPAFHG